MSQFNDPRPFYTENFTAPTSAVNATPAYISVPSNTETLIIRNAEAIGGTDLICAIYDTFGGVGGAAPTFVSIPAFSLTYIQAHPNLFNQQITLTTIPAGMSLDLAIGPEGIRSSLCYQLASAAGYIDVLSSPFAVVAGNTFVSDTNPSTGPFTLTATVGAPGVNQFQIGTGATDTLKATATATNIANAINNVANSFSTYLTASASGTRVTLTAVSPAFAPGVIGNGIPLSVTGTGLLASGPYLTGGAPDRYVLLFNGSAGTAAAQVTLVQGRGYTGPT